jgi:hypothetical protein
VTPPIDPTQLAHLLETLLPESEDPYQYLSDLTPVELLNRRIEITREIQILERERGAVDTELQRIYSDPELQWGVRGSDGWTLHQRTRTSWQYPQYIKDQIQSIQKSAQRSGDATELRTTYLVLTRQDS